MTKHPNTSTKAPVEIDVTVLDAALLQTKMSGGSVSYRPQVMLVRTPDRRNTHLPDLLQILEPKDKGPCHCVPPISAHEAKVKFHFL